MFPIWSGIELREMTSYTPIRNYYAISHQLSTVEKDKMKLQTLATIHGSYCDQIVKAKILYSEWFFSFLPCCHFTYRLSRTFECCVNFWFFKNFCLFILYSLCLDICSDTHPDYCIIFHFIQLYKCIWIDIFQWK